MFLSLYVPKHTEKSMQRQRVEGHLGAGLPIDHVVMATQARMGTSTPSLPATDSSSTYTSVFLPLYSPPLSFLHRLSHSTIAASLKRWRKQREGIFLLCILSSQPDKKKKKLDLVLGGVLKGSAPRKTYRALSLQSSSGLPGLWDKNQPNTRVKNIPVQNRVHSS